MANGKLFLIPTILSEGTVDKLYSVAWKETIKHIRTFCVEDVRWARRFLGSLKVFPPIETLQFTLLNKETPAEKMSEMLKPLSIGEDIGILSESGIPAVADPGSLAVAFAHANGFQVTVLPGPSSIMLALAGSGLSGQQFAFHGYLPIDEKECAASIRSLDKESRSKNQTQIFIETPFRNNRLLRILQSNLSKNTNLCVAIDLTGDHESIISKRVSQWPKVQLPKLPSIFLFQASQ